MPKGYVSVELKTSNRIKAYLENNFGNDVIIDCRHIFHNYMILCLCHDHTRMISAVPIYVESIKLYITKDDYERYGCYMNPRQMQLFNIFVDDFMKAILEVYLDTYFDHNPKPTLVEGVAFVYQKLNLTEDDWDTDTINKYYYRSRKKRERNLLYNKK